MSSFITYLAETVLQILTFSAFKRFILFLCISILFASMSVYIVHAWQRLSQGAGTLELRYGWLLVATWVLGTGCWSFGKTANTLTTWVISPALDLWYFILCYMHLCSSMCGCAFMCEYMREMGWGETPWEVEGGSDGLMWSAHIIWKYETVKQWNIILKKKKKTYRAMEMPKK